MTEPITYRSAFISSVCCGAPTDLVVGPDDQQHYCSECSAPTHPGWDQRSPLLRPDSIPYEAPRYVRPVS